MWAIYRRDSTDVQVGGGGISTFLAGTGKFQFLVNYKCRFVARYLDNRNFVIKCNIPDIIQKYNKTFQKTINLRVYYKILFYLICSLINATLVIKPGNNH